MVIIIDDTHLEELGSNCRMLKAPGHGVIIKYDVTGVWVFLVVVVLFIFN